MEIQINELIEKYKLSQEEHNEVLEILKKDLYNDKMIEENPSVMFVIGQPGSGKTTFIKSSNVSKYVIINSDDYRPLNKYSNEILKKYPTNYAKLTNFDAHLWGDELFSYAIQHHYSVLREKAPTDNSLLEVIKTIPSNYNIAINVIVTGNLSSLLATRERYEKEIVKNNKAKLSNIDAHNKSYALLPNFILECILLGAKVNYIEAINKKFKEIPVKENYLSLLQELREKSNEQARLTYHSRMNNIKKSMIDRNASPKQFEELSKIEIVYSELKNNK